MMIEKHISALLYRYQCVSIPEFGAFITEISSARYNEVSGTFSPPKKNILFNALLRNNDGLLTNHIALEEGISFEAAAIQVRNTVNAWNASLRNKECVALSHIGQLRMNEEQKIIFEPIGSTNYLTSSFGLSSVIAPVVVRDDKTEALVIPINRKGTKRKALLKYAAIFVVGLGLATAYTTYQQQMVAEQEMMAVEKQVQNQVQEKLQQATFFIETPTVIVKETAAPAKGFHIIAGAFRTEAKAQIMVQQLLEKGYVNAKYLNPSKHGMRQVVYNSYETLEEAKQDLKLIHTKVNKDAWIYIDE